MRGKVLTRNSPFIPSYMSSNYPYGLDPNYGASYLPPGAPPTAAAAAAAGMGLDDGKAKEDGGKGKDALSSIDSSKVRGLSGGVCGLRTIVIIVFGSPSLSPDAVQTDQK